MKVIAQIIGSITLASFLTGCESRLAMPGGMLDPTPVARNISPSAPLNFAATASDGGVTLSWSAPISDGGSAISDYTILHSSDGGISWSSFSDGTSSSTGATVTGLTNGIAYVFRVAAVNSAGAGVYSAPSVPVTPYTTPGTPTSVVATSGQNGQVPISWSAPASNGSAITNYSYQYSSDGGVNWSTAALTGSSATSFTVAGLTNGTPYVFRVAGVNAAGTGSYGQTSSSVTPRAVPGAPTSVVATSGQNGQVPISWSAPASNGGNAHRWGLRLKITMQIGITPHGIR